MLYWPHIGRRVNCGYRPYGSSNFSKCLGDGGFTHLRHNVPCAGGWFASTSISQAAVICSPTRALYMTGLGFPCTMPPILNARVPTAQSDSTPARASINISICRVPCWMNKECTAGVGCLGPRQSHVFAAYQLASKCAKEAGIASWPSKTETNTRMVENPLVFFLEPDTPTTNKSSP